MDLFSSGQLISAGRYADPNIYDIASGRLTSPQPRLESMAFDIDALAIAISLDGKTIAAGREDKTIILFDATSLAEMRTLKGHRDKIFSLAYSPDGTTLLSACRDRTLKLWDAVGGRLIRSFEGHADSVLAASIAINIPRSI